MARLDPSTRVLHATLVVFGARQSGKSTMLRALRDRLPSPPNRDTPTVALREPLLDWLPLDLGEIGSWRVRLDLYAVSSRAHYTATRRLLLADADGVFVMVDSQAARLDDNLAMLGSLREGLEQPDSEGRTVPRVFCFSKQDLPAELILAPAALNASLNPAGDPAFGADLLRGRGALDPLHALVTRVLRRHATPAAED
ncbi:MAG TPA: GTPase domain-containing protein [Gemmatimonadales bacterium]|nr:GTPase domain-containing protein [Gemmatimonadales bacterium]